MNVLRYLLIIIAINWLGCAFTQSNEAINCAMAYQKNVDSIYTTHTIESGQTEYWISFTASSPKIELRTYYNAIAPEFTSIKLYSGNCDSLFLIETKYNYSLGEKESFTSLLNLNQTYFIAFEIYSDSTSSFEAALNMKSLEEGPLMIVNGRDTTYCYYSTAPTHLECHEITVCSGDTLCFSAIDLVNTPDSMLLYIDEVYGNIGQIIYAPDSSEVCVIFPYSGNQTIIIWPYSPFAFGSIGINATFPYNNYLDAQGDTIGNISNYFYVNVIDSVPPGTNNASEGVPLS